MGPKDAVHGALTLADLWNLMKKATHLKELDCPRLLLPAFWLPLTLTGPPRTVNNDRTETDQWDAAIAVKPAGTEMFIGYYSRQNDPVTNSWIMAYGAKGDVANGLANATFDCFPISTTMFQPLFNGTNAPVNMQFDPVYAPSTNLCFNEYAMIACLPIGDLCPAGDLYHFYDSNWFQDDNTWADADSNYFYYTWCDRTRTWSNTNSIAGQPSYSRPDADVKFAVIK
jgi:hypothetical protein